MVGYGWLSPVVIKVELHTINPFKSEDIFVLFHVLRICQAACALATLQSSLSEPSVSNTPVIQPGIRTRCLSLAVFAIAVYLLMFLEMWTFVMELRQPACSAERDEEWKI